MREWCEIERKKTKRSFDKKRKKKKKEMFQKRNQWKIVNSGACTEKVKDVRSILTVNIKEYLRLLRINCCCSVND
jgi:hypothetical protein